MRAAVFHGPGDLVVEELPDPVADPGSIVLEVTGCGVCGSDIHAWSRGALVRPGQVLGHEFAGRVHAVGDGVDGITVGDRVTAMPFTPCHDCGPCRAGRTGLCERAFRASIANGLPGGFAELLQVPGARLGDTVHPLPDTLPDRAAVLVEPLAVGLQAVDLAAPEPGEVAVVLGIGSVGLAVVHALRGRGVEHVVATDLSPVRLQAAAAAGAIPVHGQDDDLEAVVADLTGRGPYGSPAAAGAVIECSGSARLLATGIRLAGMAARIVLVGIHGTRPELDANLVVRKGLTLTGSFAYEPRHFSEAIDLLATGQVDADDIVTHRFGLDQVGEAFAVQADPQQSVKVVVEPGGTHA
jgi:(R,R)-butanediol dehydrogenase / meso-butanediol dehydrogenase / diacetyl reductase